MGSGKTTVGQRCAQLLDRTFVDTDELVVAAAGISFDELWAEIGEPGFRERERVAVADAIASPEPLVISCGGGAVLDPDNRRSLRDGGIVVWLEAPPEVLASRLADDHERPLLAGGDRTVTLERLRSLREPAYEAAAHVRVDTEDRTVDEVAVAVIEEYRACNA
jgi:shikimate kinase